MTRGRFSRRCIPNSLVLLIAVGVLLVGAATAQAAGAPSLAAAYSSNGVSANIRGVQPTVSGLFQVNAPRAWADALDASGNPGQNGVPDFLDTWEAFRTRTSSAILKNGYAFTRIDEQSHEILYAGVERASAGGPSSVTLEFNQKPGERTIGDLKIIAEIDAAGNVGTVSFESYAGGAKGSAKFLPVAILAGEGCNDAGTACVVANGALLEVGYNLTALGKPEKDFAGIQIRTPEDSAVGTFTALANNCMQDIAGFNLNCNANDVKVSRIFNAVVTDNGCTSPSDTVTFSADVEVVLNASTRYDIGLYFGTDGLQALTGTCVDKTLPTSPDPPFVTLDGDQCGDINTAHSPMTLSGTYALSNITVPCSDPNGDGTIDIPTCQSWRQPGKDLVCNGINQAFPGSPSKCDCGFTPVTCVCVPTNECYTAACDASNRCVQTPKTAGLPCTDDGNVCTNDICAVSGTPPTASCSHPALSNGPVTGCSGTADQCNSATQCFNGRCQAGGPLSGPCEDGNACTTGDVCSGGICVGGPPPNCDSGNVCKTDGCNTATGCTHTNNTNTCSDGNACTVGDVCRDGACVPGATRTCPDPDQCHTPGTCNTTTGECSNPARDNGYPCNNDGNRCTSDTCQGGTCTIGGCAVIPENWVCTAPS